MADESPVERSGEEFFVSQLGLIERVTASVCRQHFVSPADTEDFASHVTLKLIERDYAVIRKYERRSAFRTYLTIVIQRLFLDYRISQWGKWRPSEGAKRLGSAGVLFEQLRVRDGLPFDQVCSQLRTNHGVQLSDAEFERIAAQLPARVRRHFETDEVLEQMPAPDQSADALAAERERERTAERVTATMRRVMLGWETEDQLILVMRFRDGRTVATIAATLHKEQKPLFARIDRLLRALRAGFEEDGIDSESVMEMLASPAVSMDWSMLPPENRLDRPSTGEGAA
jgi:RNA polymerase sigma factor (sigma-70 family)